MTRAIPAVPGRPNCSELPGTQIGDTNCPILRHSLRTCLYSHILIMYLRHYDGFHRGLVVTYPPSLGAVRVDVVQLPRVALGTVSWRILRVVTGIVCLWTLVMLFKKPNIWSSYMSTL